MLDRGEHSAKTIPTNLLTGGNLKIYLYQSGSNFPKGLYSLYNSKQDWGTKKARTPILVKFHRSKRLKEPYLKKPNSTVLLK